jgi:hypothetical protein
MLTDSGVHAAKPREKRYKLTDSRGLYLLVTPQGGRYWRLKFRLDGKERLMSLGVYPDVSLPTARLHRDKMRAQIAAGVDPLEARGTKRARTASADAEQVEPQLDKVQRIGSEPARQAFNFPLVKPASFVSPISINPFDLQLSTRRRCAPSCWRN